MRLDAHYKWIFFEKYPRLEIVAFNLILPNTNQLTLGKVIRPDQAKKAVDLLKATPYKIRGKVNRKRSNKRVDIHLQG